MENPSTKCNVRKKKCCNHVLVLNCIYTRGRQIKQVPSNIGENDGNSHSATHVPAAARSVQLRAVGTKIKVNCLFSPFHRERKFLGSPQYPEDGLIYTTPKYDDIVHVLNVLCLVYIIRANAIETDNDSDDETKLKLNIINNVKKITFTGEPNSSFLSLTLFSDTCCCLDCLSFSRCFSRSILQKTKRKYPYKVCIVLLFIKKGWICMVVLIFYKKPAIGNQHYAHNITHN